MGGIGKTTISKVTLNNVKNIYKASCFIECIESGENKTIIVFRNVKNQSRIEDFMPIDDIFANNNSKAIKYWSEKVYEINIEELDEEKNMKLFITHYYGQEDFPNKLIDVGKNILRPCNGLLLSLKVIRRFELDRDENNRNYLIWMILKICFDDLKIKEKNMFLDICYFFCNDVSPQGMSKERTFQI
uniref:NB-ARC domain-containing protein n=1 Tax=Physcomitrium patens TaxID=3218 RepID=A0A2K1IDZ7_PHYPA|nr:hypothetical protein PHYPA_029645 [Physcomitrium patens]